MATSTQTVKNVPDWAIPYVQNYATKAHTLWTGSTITPFAGTIIATQNTDEIDGIAGLADRGRDGDEVIDKAVYELDRVITGFYLDAYHPMLQTTIGYVTTASTAIFAYINSAIGKKSMYVGDPDTTYLAQTFCTNIPGVYNNRTVVEIQYENWVRERNLQEHALGFGVEMGKHAAIDAEALRRAGVYQREYTQGTYELSHQIFLEGEEIGLVKLEIFGNALRALTGSMQTSTEKMHTNKMVSAVGGAVAGASLGFMIGGPPGAIVGGVIGLVAGLFS